MKCLIAILKYKDKMKMPIIPLFSGNHCMILVMFSRTDFKDPWLLAGARSHTTSNITAAAVRESTAVWFTRIS